MQWTDESRDMVLSEEGAQLRTEAVAWVIRLHGGDLSLEDHRTFDAWHAQSAAHAHMFQKVSAAWNSPELRAAAAAAVKPELIVASDREDGP